ncbi:SdpI family protein [Kocuria sp. CPCC 205300]|uniref:SdpI family protein n=1 Tax=Kocuria sabuli TaxID=3071448 RepID=UPI0036DF78EE
MNNDPVTLFDVVLLLGGVSMGISLLAVSVFRAAASESLTRNRFIGIKMPSTMACDEAWIAGHRAAVPLASISVFFAGVLLMVAAILVMMEMITPAFMVASISVLAVGILLVASSIKASRAARAATAADREGELSR